MQIKTVEIYVVSDFEAAGEWRQNIMSNIHKNPIISSKGIRFYETVYYQWIEYAREFFGVHWRKGAWVFREYRFWWQEQEVVASITETDKGKEIFSLSVHKNGGRL